MQHVKGGSSQVNATNQLRQQTASDPHSAILPPLHLRAACAGTEPYFTTMPTSHNSVQDPGKTTPFNSHARTVVHAQYCACNTPELRKRGWQHEPWSRARACNFLGYPTFRSWELDKPDLSACQTCLSSAGLRPSRIWLCYPSC